MMGPGNCFEETLTGTPGNHLPFYILTIVPHKTHDPLWQGLVALVRP